jgi:hypothetical protein
MDGAYMLNTLVFLWAAIAIAGLFFTAWQIPVGQPWRFGAFIFSIFWPIVILLFLSAIYIYWIAKISASIIQFWVFIVCHAVVCLEEKKERKS